MSKVIINNVNIEKAPGFENKRGPELKAFNPGLNIIYGKNGSGKTTISNSLRYTLWNKEISKAKQNNDYYKIDVKATIDGKDFIITRSGKELIQKDLNKNKTVKRENNNDEYCSNYNFSIVDLLDGDTDYLKEKIKKGLNFGLDFDQLKKSLDIKTTALTKTHTKDLNDAQKDLEKQKENIKEAKEFEEEKNKAKTQLETAEDKITQIGDIDKKIKVKEELDEKAKLEEEFNKYPKYMKYLSQPHLEHFENNKNDLFEKEREIDENQKKLAEFQTTIDKSGFPKLGIQEPIYKKQLANLKDDGKQKLAENERLLKNKKNAEADFDFWKKQNYFYTGFFYEDLEKLKLLESSWEKVNTEQKAWELYLDCFEKLTKDNTEEEEKLNKSIKKEASTGNSKTIKGLIIGIICVSSVLAILVHPIFTLLSLISLFFIDKKAGNVIDISSDVDKLIKLKMEDENNKNFEKAKEQLKNKNINLKEWETKFKEYNLGEKIGDAPFYNFSETLKCGLDLKKKVNLANQSLDQSNRDLVNYKNKVEKLLAKPIELGEITNELLLEEENFSKYIDAKEKQKDLEENIESLKKETTNLSKAIEKFWEEIGLTEKDSYLVDSNRNLYEDWGTTRLNLEAIKKELAKKGELIKLVETMDPEELYALSDEKRKLIEDKNTFSQNLGRAETNYENKINSDACLKASEKVEKEKEKLDEKRESYLESLFLDRICSEVEETNTEKNQPEIIEQANEWLKKITKGNYKVLFQDNFFVKDEINNEDKSFNQLSSGTKVQVLLALRLGALQILENSGMAYPVFFDETLANSDDERSEAISQALVAVAKVRQVFYFTAQNEEVNKISMQFDKVKEKVNLYDLDKEAKIKREPLKNFVNEKNIKLPNDYKECAQFLKVNKAKLFEQITELPIWYVFTNTDELKKYYYWNYEAIGQLSDSTDEKIKKHIEVLKKAQKLAKQGREKPITSTDLKAMELEGFNKSTNYFDELIATADSTNSAQKVLECLNEKNSTKKEERLEVLEKALIDGGFYNPGEKLGKQTILLKIAEKEDDETKQIVAQYLEAVLNV